MTGAEKHAAHAAHRVELRAQNAEKKRLKQEARAEKIQERNGGKGE